jgi:hypothetical protein
VLIVEQSWLFTGLAVKGSGGAPTDVLLSSSEYLHLAQWQQSVLEERMVPTYGMRNNHAFILDAASIRHRQ